MAGTLTTIGANRALDNILGTTAYHPTSIKIKFLTTASTDTTAGTEVSGGSYPAGGLTITFQAASGRVAQNNQVTQTNMPTCTVVGYEIVDGTTGDRLDYGTWNTARSLTLGDTYTVAANALTISVKSGS